MKLPLLLLNGLGCLLLSGLAILQWKNEHALIGENHRLTGKLTTLTHERNDASRRSHALENDVTLLKKSIFSLHQSFEQNSLEIEAHSLRSQQSAEQLKQMLAQLRQWEQAVKDRDARITALDETLRQTRSCLNEAIAALRKTQQTPP